MPEALKLLCAFWVMLIFLLFLLAAVNCIADSLKGKSSTSPFAHVVIAAVGWFLFGICPVVVIYVTLHIL